MLDCDVVVTVAVHHGYGSQPVRLGTTLRTGSGRTAERRAVSERDHHREHRQQRLQNNQDHHQEPHLQK